MMVIPLLFMAATTLVLFLRLRKTPNLRLAGLHVVVILAFAAVIGAIWTRWWAATIFGILNIFAWSLLVYIPLLCGAAGLAWFKRDRARSVAVGFVGLLGGGIGIDAMVVEPLWLDVVHHRIPTDGVSGRIVVVADIQTDHVGAWEDRVFQAIRDAEPDLVLFAGDYIQLYEAQAYSREILALRERVATLHPTWGGFAVGGDIDPDQSWRAAFEGTAIEAIGDEVRQAGPFQVTGLSIKRSHDGIEALPDPQGYSILLGHSPDYSLGPTNAELLVAGHTHGGQVVIPFYGPPITFSRVPREHAAGGAFSLSVGGTLVLSRGIGLERMDAPRIRFFCRPELTIIDLFPR
jgi:predicted MPP superfamily phosphohydrolase